MDLQLTGKRALVTGGSRDIGKAVARALAMEGVDVALLARDTVALSQAAKELAKETGRQVMGYLRTAQAVVAGMKSRGWGRIFNISGLAARTTGNTVSSIRNVAVVAMTKNLTDELGMHGINATAVHPGFTLTERNDVVLFLAPMLSSHQWRCDCGRRVARDPFTTSPSVYRWVILTQLNS